MMLLDERIPKAKPKELELERMKEMLELDAIAELDCAMLLLELDWAKLPLELKSPLFNKFVLELEIHPKLLLEYMPKGSTYDELEFVDKSFSAVVISSSHAVNDATAIAAQAIPSLFFILFSIFFVLQKTNTHKKTASIEINYKRRKRL